MFKNINRNFHTDESIVNYDIRGAIKKSKKLKRPLTKD
jgi:hypothetical protein